MSLRSEIRQGERDAKAKQSASRRAAKLASSGRIRRAGRASLRVAINRGRGIVIKAQKVTHSARGLVNYATQEKKRSELIFSNCGIRPEDLIRAMELAAKRRPDIRQPVAHITLSLHPSVGKDEKRWAEIIAKTKAELGIGDEFPCIAVRHGDTEHDHVHLIFSRVAVDGKVHDQANIGLRCAATERIIEHHFGLQLFKSAPAEVPLTKNEIEKSLRQQKKPPRMQLAAALAEAIKDRPTPQQFIERLQLAGITVKANVASTGKVSGLSFALDGVAFGGSKIHKNFGWAVLQKGLSYVENRDRDYLTQLNTGEGSASLDLAATNARIVELTGKATPTNRTIAKPGADDRAKTPSSSTKAPATTAPAGSPVTTATQDALAEIRRPGLDTLKPSSQPKKVQNHGTEKPIHSTSLNSIPAPRKEFGKFKRRAGPRGLRSLSQITLAPHLIRGELLLRNNGRDNMAARHAKDGRDSGMRLPSAAARITKPDLSKPAWQRSSSLLQSYRDAVKKDRAIQLSELDREAIESGHAPEDVINAHAIIADVPHTEAAIKVSGAAPTPEVLQHVESEYKQAAQRSAARLAHNVDPNSPKPPAPK